MNELTVTGIEEANVDDLRDQTNGLLEQIDFLEITDKKSDETGQLLMKDLRGFRRDIETYWSPLKEQAHKAHKSIVAKEKEMLEPIDKAVNALNEKLDQYYKAERAKEQERQRIAQEKVRKQLEDQQLAEAAAAEEAGDIEAAEDILNEPTPEVMVKTGSDRARVEGLSTRTIKSAEVFDKKGLILFVAKNIDTFTHLLEPSMKALNAHARSGGPAIPGVKIVEKTSRAVRR